MVTEWWSLSEVTRGVAEIGSRRPQLPPQKHVTVGGPPCQIMSQHRRVIIRQLRQQHADLRDCERSTEKLFCSILGRIGSSPHDHVRVHCTLFDHMAQIEGRYTVPESICGAVSDPETCCRTASCADRCRAVGTRSSGCRLRLAVGSQSRPVAGRRERCSWSCPRRQGWVSKPARKGVLMKHRGTHDGSGGCGLRVSHGTGQAGHNATRHGRAVMDLIAIRRQRTADRTLEHRTTPPTSSGSLRGQRQGHLAADRRVCKAIAGDRRIGRRADQRPRRGESSLLTVVPDGAST